jgi:long-chain acyl-CoA synthetase
VAHADMVCLLEDVLQLDPDAPALQFQGTWWTYGELGSEVGRAREALEGMGVGPGAPVGCVLPNRPCGLVALLAVLLERACVATVSPRRADKELLGLPPLRAVLGPAGQVAGRPIEGESGLVLDEGDGAARPMPGVALLVGTSGTTGEPRRIPVTYSTLAGTVESVRRLAKRQVARLRLREESTLICFPYTSLSGVLPQLIALVSGRRTVLLERFEPHQAAALVAEHKMTSLALNPTAMHMLLEADVDPALLETVRYVRSGSAPLRPNLAAEFEQRYGVAVLQSYGQTEVGGEVVGWSPADHRRFGDAKRGSVGRAHPHIQVCVVRRGGQPGEELPLGETGELWLRNTLTHDDWHRTGDLARLDADGFLWIEGRADDVIIRGGFNIVPAALERVLEMHPAVVEAVVVARQDDRLGQVPVAFVVLRHDAECDEEELLQLCREHLEPYQVPSAVVSLPSLPRNDVGKPHLPSLRSLAAGAVASRSRGC